MKNCFISQIFDQRFSENTAFHYVDENKKTSYRELREKVEQQHAFLINHGVKRGDYVAIAFEREEEIIILFLALASIGAITVPLNPHLKSAELKKITSIIPLKFYYTQSNFIIEHQQILIKDHRIKGLFGYNDFEGILPDDLNVNFHKYQTQSRTYSFNFPKPVDIVTLHFTMKGFGKPLGVPHSYQDYCLTLKSCNDIFNFAENKKVLSLLPCYPIFGLVTNLLYPLTCGAELVVKNKKIKNILASINQSEITHVNLVPALMDKLLLEAKKTDINKNLEHVCFVTGGSHMSSDLYNEFSKTFNTKPIQGYGLTETLIILTNTPKDSRPGTLGKLMRSDVEMKIVDARGNEVPKGKAGEIWFKGKGIISDYIGEIENSKHLFHLGWLKTGDLGYLTDDDHVVFVGRRLNFTKIQANMVDLKEVEDIAKNIIGVKSARSYVITEKGREKLCLAINVDKNFDINSKDIVEHFRNEVSNFKIPSQIKIYEK